MSDKPILFSGEMVRAILDGRKTQTRRVLKCQPLYKSAMYYVMPEDCPKAWQDCSNVIRLCPYGQIGDRLWVRETWWHFTHFDKKPDRVEYVVDSPTVMPLGWWEARKRPSIHMPRWACRLVLEITDVRVERLQDISEEDAKAEGVGRGSWPEDCTDGDAALNAECGYFPPRSYVAGYAGLWDSLNAKRGLGWESNPFVWVISFKRIDASRVDPVPAVDLSRSYPNDTSLTFAALPSTGAETAE